MSIVVSVCLFFFFNDTATTEIYTLSLHDALPISELETRDGHPEGPRAGIGGEKPGSGASPPRSQGPAGVYPDLRVLQEDPGRQGLLAANRDVHPATVRSPVQSRHLQRLHEEALPRLCRRVRARRFS